MRCLTVLGCTLLLVAGCGGGVRAVEEMVPADPPGLASEATLHTTGEARPEQVDMSEDGAAAVFYNWGVWVGVLRDDVVTCTAIDCPPAGDQIFRAYLTSEAKLSTAPLSRLAGMERRSWRYRR